MLQEARILRARPEPVPYVTHGPSPQDWTRSIGPRKPDTRSRTPPAAAGGPRARLPRAGPPARPAPPRPCAPPPGRMPRRGPRPRPAAAGAASPARATRGKRALSGGAKQEGERARVLRQPPRPLVLHERVRLVREQRLALPHAHDVLDPARLHPPREPVVRGGASAPRLRLLNARRGAHGDHRGVSLRRPEGRSQRQTPAQRVAAEHRALAGSGDLLQAPLVGVILVLEGDHVVPRARAGRPPAPKRRRPA